MMSKLIYILLAANLFIFSNQLKAELKVIYPNVNGIGKDSFGYAALKLALEHSGVNFELRVTEQKVNNSRIRILLQQKKISVSDFGTSPEFEQALQAIYFPIDLGLNGWRIFLIHKDNLYKFSEISSLIDLKVYIAGQGIGWSDTEILENAGLKVIETAKIDSLFKMTNRKRFDYFPLGANEVHSLLSAYKTISPDVVVEPKLLLIYPFGRLFFVHKDNKHLHDIIEKGLIKAYDDGSFMKLFKEHKSNRILFSQANLLGRRPIYINNPFMTENFTKIPKKYFYSLPIQPPFQ